MRHFQSLLHNRELHVISHTKQPAVQEKTARSVCPKAGPEQQLLITEVQAKRALHSPGVHWEPGIVNRLLTPGEHARAAVFVYACTLLFFIAILITCIYFFYFVCIAQHIPKF